MRSYYKLTYEPSAQVTSEEIIIIFPLENDQGYLNIPPKPESRHQTSTVGTTKT